MQKPNPNHNLYNRISKSVLKENLKRDDTKKITCSFYRYIHLDNVQALRHSLYENFSDLGILGRIYLAKEGVNAQISIPEKSYVQFKNFLDQSPYFKNIYLNTAFDDDGKSFYKLTIKIRKKIVSDGIEDKTFDPTNVGNHLNAEQFNQAMEDRDTIVVDMRNHYESEVGHFENAICLDVDTFREQLPMVRNRLKDDKDKKILLYCTGGIRCEKASAYLKHHGFEDINQLHGGIIKYAKQIKEKSIPSKFKGKNFVFDERLGERITDDILSSCHQCGEPCDQHVNCANDDCHLLFIQCKGCQEKMSNCCSKKCIEISKLPIEEQRKKRQGQQKVDCFSVYKSRLRPNLKTTALSSSKT